MKHVQNSERRARPLFRWPVRIYDRAYRRVHGLDRPAARVGPALCVEMRRNRRAHALPDGTVIRQGDAVGILHLNNARIAAVHLNGSSPQVIGLEFRRWLLASLDDLARIAAPAGPLAAVRAFSATTIFYTGLARLGFQIASGGLFFPGLVAAYQRLLLASLHPRGTLGFRRVTYRRARRLWLTREALLARYGAAPRRDSGRSSMRHEEVNLPE